MMTMTGIIRVAALLCLLTMLACDRGQTPRAEGTADVEPASQVDLCDGYDPDDKIPDAWLMCSADSDCVRAHDSCCNCTSGSNGLAIGKEYATCVTPKCGVPEACLTSVECLNDEVVCSEGLCALAPKPAVKPPSAALPNDRCLGYAAGNDVPQELLACEADADCMLAQTTCCPCSGGGEQVVIARAFGACVRPPKECERTGKCAKVYNCKSAPVCADGLCTTESNP